MLIATVAKSSAGRQRHAVGVLGLLLILACGAAAGAEPPVPPPAAAKQLPQSFRIDELTIRLSRQDGNAAYSPWIVTLSGAHGGSLMHNARHWPFAFSGKDLVALLNELYEIRFFDLPATYDRQATAMLNADGTVSVIGKFTSSATGNGFCVDIGSFEKCVRYGNRGPAELDHIFARVFSAAEHLTGAR